ncbi:Fe-S protein [Vibrio crassostreae 9ZC13]|nr:Fe-S protein [Vibrio crassostreae 9ZC13]
MEQLEFFQVPSPCVGVCSSDDKGYCNGCMRKREERFNWMSMTPSEQLHVIKLCRQRYRRKIMNKKYLIGKQVDEEGNTSPQRDLFG